MVTCKRSAFGVLLVLLAALLFSTGCTQPSGSGTITATPAPTPLATTPVMVNTSSNVTPGATANVQLQKAELTSLARKFAGEMNGTALASAAREGPNSTAFMTVLTQLRAFKATDNRLTYVYTLEQQNGTVRFIVDADYGLPGGSGYLEDYPDAPAEIRHPVTAPLAAGPYSDSYGTFISGYAPVDTGTNRTAFIIGLDMKA
jgi:hypothetical protein